jgi:hypothetical protein
LPNAQQQVVMAWPQNRSSWPVVDPRKASSQQVQLASELLLLLLLPKQLLKLLPAPPPLLLLLLPADTAGPQPNLAAAQRMLLQPCIPCHITTAIGNLSYNT